MKGYEAWEKSIKLLGKKDKGEVGKAIRNLWEAGYNPEILLTLKLLDEFKEVEQR